MVDHTRVTVEAEDAWDGTVGRARGLIVQKPARLSPLWYRLSTSIYLIAYITPGISPVMAAPTAPAPHLPPPLLASADHAESGVANTYALYTDCSVVSCVCFGSAVVVELQAIKRQCGNVARRVRHGDSRYCKSCP
jgi:hypothetical protein